MNSRIENKGSLDLCFALPLFVVLMGGVFVTSFILKHRIDLERFAWRGMFTSQPSESPTNRCTYEAMGRNEFSRLSRSFQAYALTHCSARLSRNIAPRSHPLPWARVDASLSTQWIRSGSSFANAPTLKRAMWQESMLEAGFGTLPLEFLGLPELAAALGADVPMEVRP